MRQSISRSDKYYEENARVMWPDGSELLDEEDIKGLICRSQSDETQGYKGFCAPRQSDSK